MSRVWVWPERKYEQLGASRWVVTWHTLPESWKPDYDGETPDPDIMKPHYSVFRGVNAKEEAVKALDCRVDVDYFGCPTAQEQVVDWYVEEDGVAEWRDVGEPVYANC